MTDLEDQLYTRLAGSAKLLAVWQAMAGVSCAFLATSGHPLFWWPAVVTGLALALTLVELLWYIPHLRRQAFLRGYGWRVCDNCVVDPDATESWSCLRCSEPVVDGRCSCETSPSPWVPSDMAPPALDRGRLQKGGPA